MVAEVVERLHRMLEVALRCFDVSDGDIVGGRYTSHFGFAANRLITSSAAMPFSSRIVTLWCKPRVDDTLARHVREVEHVVELLLCRQRGGGRRVRRSKWARRVRRRLVVAATETSSRSG